MEPTRNMYPVARGNGRSGKLLLRRFLAVLGIILAALLQIEEYSQPAAAHAEEAPSEQARLLQVLQGTVSVTPALAAAEGGSDVPLFSHRLYLHPRAPLPSRLIVSSAGTKLRRVRALLTLDDHLLVVPLEESADGGTFSAIFPTPEQSLTYQFQISSADGRTVLSEPLSAPLSCAVSESAARAGEALPGARRQSLKKALELHAELKLYEHAVALLEALRGEADDANRP